MQVDQEVIDCLRQQRQDVELTHLTGSSAMGLFDELGLLILSIPEYPSLPSCL